MDDATRRNRGRLSKLFNVLVAGGIALSLGCPKTQGGGKDKPDDGTARTPPSSEPAGGVRGW